MAQIDNAIVAFNRGIVSPLALARVDLKRMALSAETQNNYMPRALGSMMLRPGWGYVGSTHSNRTSRNISFVRSASAVSRLEFTENIMRVWTNDALISRGVVNTTVTNGNFDADIAGWTDNDEAGGVSVWVTGGYMGLNGNGTDAGIRDQTVTVAVGDRNDEHALRIVVERGPVTLRVGTNTSDDSYINETELGTGTHSLTFTPAGNFNIRLMSRYKRQVLVTSCNIEADGTMTLPTPWGESDLQYIRASQESQSVDVLFVACVGYTQRRIERRSATSWSIVQYLANDGPMRVENLGPTTIMPSALSGNITLTASAPLFRSTQGPSANNAGALFRITSEGQRVEASVTGENQFTATIRITGVDSSRVFTEVITGLSATGSTVTLQRSLESNTGPWVDVTTYVADTTTTIDDTLDNQEAWYRVGVKTGDYVAGTIELALDYALGSVDGFVRLTQVISSTSADAEVITDLGGTEATAVWAEGEWSDYRGWPSAVALYEARLGWFGLGKEWMSITDAYDSFDASFEGDAGTISRSIGAGPLETINWAIPLQRLLLGGNSSEQSCRSNAFDEPITPSNFNIKPCSTQGSSNVQAVKIDDKGMYVQRGGTRLFELAFNAETYDYSSIDMTMLCPEVGRPSITRIAVQRQPDTRVHCVRSDGTAAVLVYDRRENVVCWVTLDTLGDIEDVCILPAAAGTDEDRVYYQVARTVNGATVRFHEKWALETECEGGTVNKQADAFVTFTNATPSTTISGLSHLAGESVVVWHDGVCPEDADGDVQTYVVTAGGTITIDTAATTGIVGLPYDASFKSAKLGQTLNKMKNIDHVGLVLRNTHAKGVKVGRDLVDTNMDYLPLIYQGGEVDADRVYTDYDEEGQEFPGQWGTDERVCLKSFAPRPANIMAATIVGQVYA